MFMPRMSSKVTGGEKENRSSSGPCRRNQHNASKCVPQTPSSPPINPPSSPIPSTTNSTSCLVEDIEDDDLDVDVDGDEDDEQPLDDLDDLAGDNDDVEDNSPDLNHPHHVSGPANNFASSFINSSSEEDDDDGEVDESLERDESDDDDDEDDDGLEPPGFLLPSDGDASSVPGIPPDAQARLEAFFEAAGFTDGKLMSDPENLRKLTLTVSSALGEASAAINRMRDSQRKSIEEGRNDSMEEGDSLLALACSSGYFELARVLLAMGANVDDRGTKGDLTPLMDAASQGHVEIVRLLVSHGADVNAQSACGNSPLMYACAAGHEDIVRELLKSGARVEDNNENGHTPLMEAASAGHVGVAKILLDHGAGINTHSNEFKESALTVACYKGHLEMVRFLLEAGADQQHKTDEMHTALMEASMDGHVEVARLLLDSGAQVNMPADSFESPLTLAACGGHVKLAELLIERGANIEEVNDEGYTPLMEAAREGHLSVVKCLLKNEAKINAQTEETHETALTLAACGGFRDVVEVLCDSGADIELGASSPLMESSQEGHYQVVKFLIERGANVNRETQTGDTALSYACENGHVDVVELLIDKGADPEHLSEGGRNPLMKACRGGHLDVIKYLLSKGADVNRQTASNDHTPLSLACAGGHIAAVEVLLAAGANLFHKLKDNSTMIIEAARGGHTNVIRVLLDHAPQASRAAAAEKNVQGKTGPKGQVATTSSNSGASQNQGKSVLRKSRSTSTLDSSTPQQKPVEGTGSGDAVTSAKPKSGPVTVDSPLTKNSTIHMVGDGVKKQALSMAGASTPGVVNQTNSISMAEVKSISTASASTLPARKQATPSANVVAVNSASSSSSSCSHSGCCPECAKSSLDGNHLHHVHVKRPAGVEALQPGTLTSNISPITMPTLTPPGSMTSPTTLPVVNPASAGGILSPGAVATTASATPIPASTGPPLVPSQVTAQTAISERPKAKANKPSARKQNQLQQQQLQQQQLQQLQLLQQQSAASSAGASPGSDKVLTSPTSPNNITGTTTAASVSSSGNSPSSTAIPQVGQQQSPGTIMPLVDVHLQQPFSARIATAAAGGQLDGGIKLPVVPNSPPTKFIGSPTVFQMHVQQVRASSANPTGSNPSQFKKLDPKQLSQIFAQHQQQLLKGEKGKDTLEAFQDGEKCRDVFDFTQVIAGTYNSFSALATSAAGTTTQLLGGQVSGAIAVGGGLACPQGGSGGPGSTTATTTTTTVVVTHGNGETETIIEGEDLPPGANEMIMSAAAATFPMECFPLQGALQLSPASGVHVQSYQLSSPVGLGSGDLSSSTTVTGLPMTTTTMQSTTIINSSSSGTSSTSGGQQVPPFSPPILLPHPPPLPQAIKEAAASAGIVPPSGAPPPGVLKTIAGATAVKNKVPEQTVKTAGSIGIAGKAPASSSVATQAPSSCTGAASTVTAATTAVTNHQQQQQSQLKKPLAKRSRPFCPQSSAGGSNCSQQPRQSNQQTQTSTHSHSSAIGMKQNQSVASTQTTFSGQQEGGKGTGKALDVDSATESNGETSLSIAAASGHLEVVEFLISRKAHIEHRDKKGCTPLILAADGGHDKVVELLLTHGADIEAQSERTKDTALSLACTKGRYEVVDLLLKRGANKEHRNVSDYTPLSLAASGGYVNIIKLLLNSGAEINSRTGSKLGISPLMLAAMNGNTSAVKLLLDMGSDINAQIETNKNTALTLACFQGRQEVVQLLLERKANLEHRAKTGLTPLMEAANGGYVEVGKILIEKGADVNAPPVPATRDTALTIAADKGHYRFVELLLMRGAIVDARNKKGCTPLWLACHGGHLDVGQILMRGGADMDAQDNRRISCLMAAFRKGHVKVIRWIVKNVQQFPSDAEMQRYTMSIASEPDLLKRCQQCADYIRAAKDKQALEANKNANILLEELESERTREESKRMAAARRREKKKKKKLEKKQLFSGITKDPEEEEKSDEEEEEETLQEEDEYNDEDNGGIIDSGIDANSQGSNSSAGNHYVDGSGKRNRKGNKENFVNEGHNQRLLQSADKFLVEDEEPEKPAGSGKNRKKNKKKNTNSSNSPTINSMNNSTSKEETKVEEPPQMQTPATKKEILKEKVEVAPDSKQVKQPSNVSSKEQNRKSNTKEELSTVSIHDKMTKKLSQSQQQPPQSQNLKDSKNSASNLNNNINNNNNTTSTASVTKKSGKNLDSSHLSSSQSSHHLTTSGPEPLMGIALNPSQLRKNTFDHSIDQHHSNSNQQHLSHAHSHYSSGGGNKHSSLSSGNGSISVGSSVGSKQMSRKDEGWKEVTRNCTNSRSKKINVPSSVISRVIGRGGCNINAIREATGAHIEVEKQVKNQVQPERIIQIKGSAECVKQAHNLITALMNEPDSDVKKLLGSGLRLTVNNSNLCSSMSVTNPASVVNSSSVERNTTISSILSTVCGNPAEAVLGIKPLVGSVSGKTKSQQQSSKIPASPPIIPPKNNASSVVSPSIKKPTPVISTTSSNAATFKAVSAGKRSLIIVPSQNSTLNQMNNNSTCASFAAKLSHQQQQQHTMGTFVAPPSTMNNPPRNATPTPPCQPQQQQNKTSTPTPVTPTPVTPPPQLQQLPIPQMTPSLNASPILGPNLNSHQSNKQPQLIQIQPNERSQPTNSSPSLNSLITATGSLSAPSVPTPVGQGKDGLSVRNQNGVVLNPQILSPSGFVSQPPTPINNQQLSGTTANLAPGAGVSVNKNHNVTSNVVGGNRPNANITENNNRIEGPAVQGPSGTQTPLEYSPFNYTFSKTTGWFPGDLANPSMNNSGLQQPLLNSHQAGNSNHILGGSSVARAMNFASVAASGISSSSLSTTTAQMTQASGIPNGSGLVGSNVVGSLVAGLNLSGSSSKTLDSMADSDVPKADASKAPGYRGNTSMSSPVLRMQQQQHQPQLPPGPQNSGFSVLEGHLSHYVGLNPTSPSNLLPGNITNHGGNVLNNPNTPPNLMTPFSNRTPQQPPQQQASHEGMNVTNHALGQSRTGAAFGHHIVPPLPGAHPGQQQQPPPQHNTLSGLSHQDMSSNITGSNPMIYQNNSGGPVAGVPTNVVISSRLNPRAPSFNLPMNKQQPPPPSLQQQPQQPSQQGTPPQPTQPQNQNQPLNQPPQSNNSPMSSAFPMSAIHQQFKNLGMSQPQPPQFGRQNRGAGQQGGAGGWAGAYGITGDHMMDFQGLDLTNSGGVVDTQAMLSRMDTLHDNQNLLKLEDRRLPRPIGGERAWKNTTNTSGAVNITPFTVLDCLDTNQLPQPIQIPPSHSLPNVQGAHNMGPHSNHQGQQPQPWLNMYPNSNSQQPQFATNNPPPLQQQHLSSHGPPPPPNRDGRNFLGRRFVDEMDASRLLEMQQMYDNQQRLMNGTGVVPPMMHMGSGQQPMYPFGLEHMEHPKEHTNWETNHLNMMDDKHMGWGANKWN